MPTTPTRTVLALGWAPMGGGAIRAVRSLEVDAGGVLGDRYRSGTGFWSGHRTSSVTMISSGEVTAAEQCVGRTLNALILRRNIVISGPAPAYGPGVRLRVGPLLLEVERPCDPCTHLEALLGVTGLRAALQGRGGLRLRVLDGGWVSVGDDVRVETP